MGAFPVDGGLASGQCAAVESQAFAPIRTCPVPACCVCGERGITLYTNVQDPFQFVPGRWTVVRCVSERCATMWLSPMPIADDIARMYQSYTTHDDQENSFARRAFNRARRGYLYHKLGGARPPLVDVAVGMGFYLYPPRREDAEFPLRQLGRGNGRKLLDVGCGDGSLLRMMLEYGWDCQGLDFDDGAVRNAARKGLHVACGTLEEQRYAEAAFDAITMSHVIEHVPEPLALLSECRRILKPGGRLVLVTPNSQSLGRKMFGSSWSHLAPPYHLRIFSPHSLSTLASRAGFRTVRTATLARTFESVAIESVRIRFGKKLNLVKSRPAAIRLPAMLLQCLVWAALQFRPNDGEEILLTSQ